MSANNNILNNNSSNNNNLNNQINNNIHNFNTFNEDLHVAVLCRVQVKESVFPGGVLAVKPDKEFAIGSAKSNFDNIHKLCMASSSNR